MESASPGVSVRICLVLDLVCPTRRMARNSLKPFARLRPVGRLPRGGALDGCLSAPEKIVARLHVN